MLFFKRWKERLRRLYLTHWSTYFAFLIWGASAFTAQPTIAGLVVHMAVIPLAMLFLVLLARHEGRKDEERLSG